MFCKIGVLEILQNSEKNQCGNSVLAQDLGAEVQKDRVMVFEELFSVTYMYGCHG